MAVGYGSSPCRFQARLLVQSKYSGGKWQTPRNYTCTKLAQRFPDRVAGVIDERLRVQGW